MGLEKGLELNYERGSQLTLCSKMQIRGLHPGTDGRVVDPSIDVFLKVLRTTYTELCESRKQLGAYSLHKAS